MSEKDGGQAFPMALPDIALPPDEAFALVKRCQGMSLRDWFAGQALVGWLSYNGEYVDMTSDTQGEKVAAWSYEIADAMIAQRAK